MKMQDNTLGEKAYPRANLIQKTGFKMASSDRLGRPIGSGRCGVSRAKQGQLGGTGSTRHGIKSSRMRTRSTPAMWTNKQAVSVPSTLWTAWRATSACPAVTCSWLSARSPLSRVTYEEVGGMRVSEGAPSGGETSRRASSARSRSRVLDEGWPASQNLRALSPARGGRILYQ